MNSFERIKTSAIHKEDMSLSVICCSNSIHYKFIIDRLKAQEFHPIALEDPYSGKLYLPHIQTFGRDNPAVYIAVPTEERIYADKLLAEWEKDEHIQTIKIKANAFRTAMNACLAAAIFAAVLVFFGLQPHETLIPAAGAWTLAFLFMIIKREKQNKQQRLDKIHPKHNPDTTG